MSKNEREAACGRREREAWEGFRTRLADAAGFKEAAELAADAPPPDAPGRRFYSNLTFFLQSFIVPGGSSREERGLYLALVQRMDAAGQLRRGVGARVAAELQRSIADATT